jgi:hypothetical protein
MGDTTMAQNWHEQQLDMALKTRDRVAEGRACSNLGTYYKRKKKRLTALLVPNKRKHKRLTTLLVPNKRKQKKLTTLLFIFLTMINNTSYTSLFPSSGIVYQLRGDHDSALKLHQVNKILKFKYIFY